VGAEFLRSSAHAELHRLCTLYANLGSRLQGGIRFQRDAVFRVQLKAGVAQCAAYRSSMSPYPDTSSFDDHHQGRTGQREAQE
jgi:hypothetical protein